MLWPVAIHPGFPPSFSRRATDFSQYSTATVGTPGDINGSGTPVGNSYSVITAIDVDQSAVLNGFHITGGNASGFLSSESTGGGVYINSASPVLRNLRITGNRAVRGGGLSMFNSEAVILNTRFIDNYAIETGGAVLHFNSDGKFLNTIFWNNESEDHGGAFIHVEQGSPHSGNFVNSLFVENSSQSGGAIYQSGSGNMNIYNSIFHENTATGSGSHIFATSGSNVLLSHSLVEGGINSPGVSGNIDDAGGNIDEDPLFTDQASGIFTVDISSKVIVAGSNDPYA